ncbi:Uncharacterised protein [uncultured archaeon]|nr:Uncharacterised protein [uncultured archaeon]
MRSLTNLIAAGALALSIAGCAPAPTISMQNENFSNGNYEVKRVAVFTDNLAYQSRRGIYEITDKQTGKTYIGISGVGITEKGLHSAGKTVVQDER